MKAHSIRAIAFATLLLGLFAVRTARTQQQAPQRGAVDGQKSAPGP